MARPLLQLFLRLCLPSLRADCDFKASLRVTFPLRDLIHNQHQVYSFAALDTHLSARADIRRERRLQATTEANSLRDDLSPSLQRAMDLAHKPGSSSWLTSLPIEEHGFYLHKGRVPLWMRLPSGMAGLPSRAPTSCACGANFSIDHVLSCSKGGFPSICHNELRDLTATLLTEVCNDVCIEPEYKRYIHVQPSGAQPTQWDTQLTPWDYQQQTYCTTKSRGIRAEGGVKCKNDN